MAITVVRAGLPQTADPPEGPYEGRHIAAIRYVPAAQPYSLATLESINPIKVGDPFDITAVGNALQRLHETGRYTEITVDASLAGQDVVLEFRTFPATFVGRVFINGANAPPNSSQLASASQLELGQDFTEEYLLQATQSIEAALKDNGFYHASIRSRIERDPAIQQADIFFDLKTGKRAHFTTPIFQGDLKNVSWNLLRATRWQSLWGVLGYKQFTDSRLKEGVERIRYSFQKRDFLSASVTLEKLRYLENNNDVEPAVNIQPGPLIRIETTGSKLSRGKLRQLVPVFQERTVDRDLLVEGSRNIEQYFQSRGYFDASTEFETAGGSKPGERIIDYTIDAGPRYKVTYVSIAGNLYFNEKTVRERLSVIPATRIRYRNGRFSDELLKRDVAAIEYLYRSNGFRDVNVAAKVVRGFQGKDYQVAVFYEIEEGPQWFVNSLEINGVNLKDLDKVRSLMQSLEGQPYSNAAVASDRDAILRFYFDNGFPNAKLTVNTTIASAAHQVNLRFDVEEGIRNFVREVILEGLNITKPGVVYKRIDLHRGDPLSQSAMVEAQRRLYDLGIFAKVDMALQNPAGVERDKYVLYSLDEASRYSFTLGFGAQLGRIGGGNTSFDAPAGAPGFSPRASIGLSRSNFLGIGHTVGIRGQISAFQRRAVANYFAPEFLGQPSLNLNVTNLYDDSRDIRTFASKRLEGSVQLGQRLSKANSAQYRFTYRKVSVDEATLNISSDLIPIYSQPVRIGIASLSFIQDRRDDPIETRRGVYNTLDFGAATKFFGSQSGFLRLLLRNSSYHRIRRDMVFARNLTLGGMYSLNGTAPGNDVPLPERFFAGGGASHRGFPDNQAGPRDLTTGFPLGGKALLLNTLELRMPLLGDNLGGVVFHDMGNVFSDIDKITFRVRQHDIKDFDYMVHTIGYGIRYRTPVGPIRLDFGYSLNSPRFFGFIGSRDDLLAGRGMQTEQRISRFQFHFSLGQTF